MRENTVAHSIWELTPGLTDRLIELHALSGVDQLSMQAIAAKLSAEFKVELTKNSVIGRSHRLKLELRDNVPFVRKNVEKKMTPRRKVDAPIPPPLEPRCEDAGLTIYQLGYGDCRWIREGVESYPPYTYCGKPAVTEGASYCRAHYKRAHNGGKVWL
jgi:hypothetical protein